ncbi:MAG: hypothetical protein KFB92_04445 [Alcanivorax sp.]|nr:MAG: hypothetical protein KFB92_04445 [Alcanivorax sp.]
MSRSAKGAALIAALALAVVAPWLAAAGAGDTAFTEAERAEVEALAVPLGDTPPEAASTELADFGQHLFFDRRLSGAAAFPAPPATSRIARSRTGWPCRRRPDAATATPPP